MGSWLSSRRHDHHDHKKPQRGKGGEISDKDRAILQLKLARDNLERFKKRGEQDAARYHEQARQLLAAHKKDRALLCLKIKKYKEQQLSKIDAQLLNLHEMVETVEWENQQLAVFDGLKAGNRALKAIHEEMPVEAVERLMEETQDAISYEREVSELLGTALTQADEEAALRELEEIQAEEGVDVLAALPSAPVAAVTATAVAADAKEAVAEREVEAKEAASSGTRQRVAVAM